MQPFKGDVKEYLGKNEVYVHKKARYFQKFLLKVFGVTRQKNNPKSPRYKARAFQLLFFSVL